MNGVESVVFLSLLVLADPTGLVADAGGERIAEIAALSPMEARDALASLAACERIQVAPYGWRVRNFGRYQAGDGGQH